jgi:hypothetical protein
MLIIYSDKNLSFYKKEGCFTQNKTARSINYLSIYPETSTG